MNRRTLLAPVVAVVIGALVASPASAAVVPDPISVTADGAAFTLAPLGSYETGTFDASAQEIVAAHRGRLFTVNAALGEVEVLDARAAAAPTRIGRISAVGVGAADGSTVPDGAVANSVAVRADGLGLIAVESAVKTDPGWLVLFDASRLRVLGAVRVGAQPDMVTFAADGRTVVVANEGEPSDDYSVDPEGSVAVVSLSSRLRAVRQDAVRIADFHGFEDALPEGVRVFGPTVDAAFPVSANLEPEYIAISGRTAYVTLQENNAIAVVDLRTAKVTDLWPLGFKDYGVTGLDPSDKDSVIDIRTVPGLRGLYQPDSIAAYTARGHTYLVTANEGDAREWGDYEEGVRVKSLGKKGVPPICADSPLAAMTADEQLGRLNVSTASGLSADGSCFENLYTFGTRSFSVWEDGRLVFDSGDAFEQITAEAMPEFFNSNHSGSNLEGRSDDKGPEPEGVAVGTVGGRTYAFIGLERVGGLMAYDITRPATSSFVSYVNNRDFSQSVEDGGSLALAGDLGAEGVTFIAAKDSPTRAPLVAVANEVSGTTTLFELDGLSGRGGSGRPCPR